MTNEESTENSADSSLHKVIVKSIKEKKKEEKKKKKDDSIKKYNEAYEYVCLLKEKRKEYKKTKSVNYKFSSDDLANYRIICLAQILYITGILIVLLNILLIPILLVALFYLNVFTSIRVEDIFSLWFSSTFLTLFAYFIPSFFPHSLNAFNLLRAVQKYICSKIFFKKNQLSSPASKTFATSFAATFNKKGIITTQVLIFFLTSALFEMSSMASLPITLFIFPHIDLEKISNSPLVSYIITLYSFPVLIYALALIFLSLIAIPLYLLIYYVFYRFVWKMCYLEFKNFVIQKLSEIKERPLNVTQEDWIRKIKRRANFMVLMLYFYLFALSISYTCLVLLGPLSLSITIFSIVLSFILTFSGIYSFSSILKDKIGQDQRTILEIQFGILFGFIGWTACSYTFYFLRYYWDYWVSAVSWYSDVLHISFSDELFPATSFLICLSLVIIGVLFSLLWLFTTMWLDPQLLRSIFLGKRAPQMKDKIIYRRQGQLRRQRSFKNFKK